METPRYEKLIDVYQNGISWEYVTVPGGYSPLHWHDEMEILYALNGEVEGVIEGKGWHIPHRQFLVIPQRKIHSTCYHGSTTMFLRIHLNMGFMQHYMPDIDMYQIFNGANFEDGSRFKEYLDICKLFENFVRITLEDGVASSVEASGLILQILGRLIRYFSEKRELGVPETDKLYMQRIRTIITYVEEHYREKISLSDIADVIGIAPESFCRFFKQSMGMSLLKYVNEVRAAHIYQDLIFTDDPVAQVAENNGFTNQKLFNRTFKEIYGCTPSSVRKKKA